MSIKKVDSTALAQWVDGLIAEQKVVGVKAKGDRFEYGPLVGSDELRLDYDVTVLSPKAFLQPPREKLLSFDETGYTSAVGAEPMVLLGVHPYDMVAISQMDQVFSQDNDDVHYGCRREKTTIVVSDVQNASENVFAGYMGTAYVEDLGDVLLTKVGDEYIVEARTEKGQALVKGLAAADDADEAALSARKDVREKNEQALRKHTLAAAPSEWPGLLDAGYDDPVWEEKAELCFACGSCTLTCPTCYCFDVREDTDWSLKKGERVRVWDGCLMTDFAKVAGDHNFRNKKAARYRHRYYRKGKYVPAKTGGRIACVGCGRCIGACVAKIANPVEVFNRLMEAK